MKYLFNRRLVPINENYEACSDETVVEIISIHDYDVRYKNEYHHEVLTEGLQNAQYCKADVFRSFIVGTVLVPDKDDLRNSEFSWGFYMHKNHLVLIEDSGRLRNIAEDLPEVRSTENTPAARFFLELLEYFIKDDVIFLQKYEDQLVAIEEDLLEDDIDDFHRDILKCRREILVLNAFYQQLMDMTEMLGENKNYIFIQSFNFTKVTKFFNMAEIVGFKIILFHAACTSFTKRDMQIYHQFIRNLRSCRAGIIRYKLNSKVFGRIV